MHIVSISENNSINSEMEVSEALPDAPPAPVDTKLYIGSDASHTPLPVVATLLAAFLVQIGLIASLFIVPLFAAHLPEALSAFALIQYIYVVCWGIFAIIAYRVNCDLYELWILGYQQFYQSARVLPWAAFGAYTAGLALLTVLGTAVMDSCREESCYPLSAVQWQQLLVVLCSLVSLGCHCRLVALVSKFNSLGLPADELVEDLGVRLGQATVYVGIGRPQHTRAVLEAQGAALTALRHRTALLAAHLAGLAERRERAEVGADIVAEGSDYVRFE